MTSLCKFLKTPLLKPLTFPNKEKGGSKYKLLQELILIASSNMLTEIQTGQRAFQEANLRMTGQKLSSLSRYTSHVKEGIQLYSSIT